MMALIPPRAQGLAFPQSSLECCRDAREQPCVGSPDLIGYACRYHRGSRPPLVRRTETVWVKPSRELRDSTQKAKKWHVARLLRVLYRPWHKVHTIYA
jgi:hypothetical protein